jgi:hypothetical protein
MQYKISPLIFILILPAVNNKTKDQGTIVQSQLKLMIQSKQAKKH